MVKEGSLIGSFPDSPIPTDVLDELEEHDAIQTAFPMMARFHGEKEVADRVVIQTDTVAVVAGYGDIGWEVEHRIETEDRDPEEVLEEVMFRAQVEQEVLLEEMDEMADSHVELEMDPDAPDES